MGANSKHEALSSGLSRYFTGQKCPSGHVAERYACNGRCCECQREAVLKMRSSNPERVRELGRLHGAKRYALNREDVLYKQAVWRANNPEKMRDARKKHYEKTKEKRIAYNVEYQAANPEKCAVWRRRYVERNPDRKRQARRTYQARKLNAMPPWADLELIGRFYTEAERLTRETGIQHHVDHIHPLKGKNFCGLHVEYNLQVIHAIENLKKGNRLSDIQKGTAFRVLSTV